MSAGKISVYQNVPITKTARLYNFDVGKSELKREHETWLILNVVGLLSSGGSLTVIGLTSRTDTGEFNLALSKRRTESVVRFLRSLAGKNFKVAIDVGLGESAAQISGDRDGVENENWRAVVLSAWNRPDPPPPPNFHKRPLPPLPSTGEKVERRVKAYFVYRHQMSSGAFGTEDGPGGERIANASMATRHHRALMAGGYPVNEKKQQVSKTAKVVFITVYQSSSNPNAVYGQFIGGDTMNYCHVQYEWREKYPSNATILLSHMHRPAPDEPGTDGGPFAYRLLDAEADLWLRDPAKAYTQLRDARWEKVDHAKVIREFIESGG